MNTDAAGPPELDALSQARLDEGRTLLTGLMDTYDQLLSAVLAERDGPRSAGRSFGSGPAFKAMSAWEDADHLAPFSVEQRRCLLFALSELLASGGQQYGVAADWLHGLTDLPLGLVVGDVRLLAAVSEPGAEIGGYEPFEYIVEYVEQLLAAHALGAASLADSIADQVQSWNVMVYHWYGADQVLRESEEDRLESRSELAEIRDQALALAGLPLAPPPIEGSVSRDDAWGLAALRWLGVIEDWPAGVAALLKHCSLAKASRPGDRWNKICRQRLDDLSEPAALLEHLLELVLTTEPVSYLTGQGRQDLLIGFNEQLIKGVIWASGLLDPPWLPEVLLAVAVRCLRLGRGSVHRGRPVQGEKIPYACFHALAASGSDASLVALARTGRATTNGSVLNHLSRIWQEVSAQRGLSADSLLEQLTPPPTGQKD